MTVRGILLVAATVAGLAQQQPPRDPTAAPPSPRGSIAGIVVSDERAARPLYRALVTLSGPGLDGGRTVVTNTDGRFQFDGLLPGRYTLTTFKDGYLWTTLGTPGPRVTGPAISLAAGGSATVAMRLAPSGVITGTVFDLDGVPAPGVMVRAISERWRPEIGSRQLESIMPPATTDDRGVYRLYGLAPGDYLVAADAAAPGQDSAQILSEEEERRAIAEIAAARPVPATESPARISSESRRTVTFAPVYYPGTAVPGRASRVRIASGDQRSGIDLQLQYANTATVQLTLVAPPPVARAALVALYGPLDMLPRSRIVFALATQDDRRVFDGVAPGRYTVAARFPLTSPSGELLASTVSDGSASWATADVLVSGEEIVDVTLTPLPVVTIAGRVRYDGEAVPAKMPVVSRFTIQASHTRGVASVMNGVLPAIEVDPEGRFDMRDIVPGPYRITTAIPGIRSELNGCWLVSFIVGGRDILDAPIDLTESASDAVIVFSDRASEIAGTVTDGGTPAIEQTVIIFSAARETWFANSRRIAASAVGADGRYSIRNLPPGDYWIAPTDNVTPGEWFDPVFLERLLPRARPVRVAGPERHTEDFVIGR